MSSSSVSNLSSLAYNFERSLRESISNNIPERSDHLSKIICAGHDIEKQIYILSLDGIDRNDDEHDRLFMMYSIDTVHLNYLAAKSRVRQYTQYIVLLKRSEEAWAQQLQEVGNAVMRQNFYRVGIEAEDDEEVLLECTADTVLASYIAAQHRVRQYTQFLTILKGEENAWAQSVRRASAVMPDYNPARSQ
ncbi:hypothetical protein EV702DRAFT_720788 [Suillus placidus]|uniref:Uncharacterized protein n=1 Tax=Suillus placidus TaxID=48579 RepID=A0A9P6ZK37_9AGAM|nr:hypothetical protein EV702DRAFT_720788 [Suillus placidus]